MRVIVDALGGATRYTGVGRYSLALLDAMTAMDHGLTLEILVQKTLSGKAEVLKFAARPHTTVLRRSVPAIGPARDLTYLVQAITPGEGEVYHCLSSNYPWFMGGTGVVTIHDLKYLKYPRYLGRFWWLKAVYMRGAFANAVSRARTVIAVSESTKSDLLDLYGQRHAEKIKVIHEASTMIAGTGRTGPDRGSELEPYFLYVGEQRPHKNLPRICRAFSCFRARWQGHAHKLLLVGGQHASSDLTQQYEGILALGQVTDEQLESLYRGAVGFVFASLYEGFGIPILEAMSVGTPVITSRVSSMPEVAADAAILVDPENEAEICEAMMKLAGDPQLRARLAARGRERASNFSWQRAAEETIRVYHECLRARPS